MYTLAGSAPGHTMLLPTIHIPKAPLPFCSHPYPDPSGLESHREGRPACLASALGSWEEGYNQWKKKDPVTKTNTNQPTTRNGQLHWFGNDTKLAWWGGGVGGAGGLGGGVGGQGASGGRGESGGSGALGGNGDGGGAINWSSCLDISSCLSSSLMFSCKYKGWIMPSGQCTLLN